VSGGRDHAEEADLFWPGMGEFKSTLCDETKLIADALRVDCHDWLRPPILDVGSGIGDIARVAFPEMRAVLLDLHRTPESVAPNHKFVRGDFFNYVPARDEGPRTVLFCHVLQYLDSDWARFRSKVAQLDPKVIIAVTNDNDDIFGRLVAWARSAIPDANPEQTVVELEAIYRLRKRVPIKATLRCADFSVMAKHLVVGILDAALHPEVLAITARFLRERLAEPRMSINQTIYCYEKN
jgi:hypothetical protein